MTLPLVGLWFAGISFLVSAIILEDTQGHDTLAVVFFVASIALIAPAVIISLRAFERRFPRHEER